LFQSLLQRKYHGLFALLRVDCPYSPG